MPNPDKTIHCQGKRRKRHPTRAEKASLPRHAGKAHDNNTQTIPNNLLAKIGNSFAPGWAGLETFSQQPCSPGSCRSVALAKALLFVKAAPILAKKVTAAIFGFVLLVVFVYLFCVCFALVGSVFFLFALCLTASLTDRA